ncbi:hypothetical protein Purlil1_1569 [Purpureocillium lilacinum]|uniref:Uncharacterized protein n=1 Tax=Purpureocillium lilacinum TaxID=33203 RepID=A0ABR0CCD6_PURLI|nr:hypothetical protein Purlil1_1569 [Purpureocillium lilacinum]
MAALSTAHTTAPVGFRSPCPPRSHRIAMRDITKGVGTKHYHVLSAAGGDHPRRLGHGQPQEGKTLAYGGGPRLVNGWPGINGREEVEAPSPASPPLGPRSRQAMSGRDDAFATEHVGAPFASVGAPTDGNKRVGLPSEGASSHLRAAQPSDSLEY